MYKATSNDLHYPFTNERSVLSNIYQILWDISLRQECKCGFVRQKISIAILEYI